MRGTYGAVLGRRDVLSALVPYLLARLPLSMSSLALLLLVRAQTGSYHRAGLVGAAYGLAVAVAAPVLGRIVDRRGQSRVLLVCGLAHPAAMAAVVVAAHRGVFALVVVGAMLAGACLPPIAACMRVLWARLLEDGPHRQAGYALEGVLVEVAELSGPLLVTVALLLGRPAGAVLAGAALTGVGTLLFRLAPASRAVPVSSTSTRWWGALAVPGVRRLLIVIFTSTSTIGGLELVLVAFARAHDDASLTGIYVAVVSAGGIVAGLVFGGVERLRARRRGVLATTLLLSGAVMAAMAAVHSIALLFVMLFVFGAAVAVSVVVQLAIMSDAAPDAVRTEAFTWGGTANFVGLAAGTLGTGWVLDKMSVPAAFVVAAVPAVLAAAVAVVGRERAVEATASTVVPERAAEAMSADDVARRLIDAAIGGAPDDEIIRLQAQIADLEAALEATLLSTVPVEEEARIRAQRMLDRADAACLEMRERAEDDAARVRAAATTAALEIMSAAERDARAVIARAQREAETIVERARRTARSAWEVPPQRPSLRAVESVAERFADDELKVAESS